MQDFRLRCIKCGSEYMADEIESGEMPDCERCQGKLEIVDKVKLACLHCSLEGIPDSIPMDTILICENCTRPLTILSIERVIPPSQIAEKTPVDDTIALALKTSERNTDK